MAATAWEFFNSFKEHLGKGDVDLTGTNTTFKMILLGSASTVESHVADWSIYTSVNGELASANGYTQGGKALTVNWSVKTTTSAYSWTFNTVTFTAAAASALTNIKYVLIMTQTASILVCYSKLTTAAIDLSAGQELNIYPNPIAFDLS